MTRAKDTSAFALVITLILLALIAIIVVAYLASTRTERSTSSVYANRLRAQINAESALAGAIHLLRDNTRYGNYITAMPAPTTPQALYTEIYRPADPTDAMHATKPNDFLQLSNAAGELLLSRATPGSSPGPDARPSPDIVPTPLPAGAPFALPSPNPALAATNSYDFNQIVRIGGSSTARLVNPAGQNVFGQWVNVRNNATPPEVIGRYAFFVEDESMKVNVNVSGNNIGGVNMRVNDLASPTPTVTPASQIQEVDPSALLATQPAPTPDRTTAVTVLAAVGAPGARMLTSSSLAVLPQWNSSPSPTPFPNYAHLVTVLSRDDNTTARGWQRLNINKIVADAESAGTAQAKKDGAIKIANWTRDAWTGATPMASLQDYQLYGDDWSRKQIAANIVDYADSDSKPTDMGDIIPAGFTTAVPVIGLEKMPYLSGVYIVYQASNSTYPGTGPGSFTATMKMKVQLQFLNLYDTTLDLADVMGTSPLSRIEVKGIPVVTKNGSVYDVSSQTWTIKLSDLTPVKAGTGTTVAAGVDGTSTSGARTFQSDWLDTRGVSFTVAPTGDQNPKLSAANITVKIIGNKTGNAPDDYRIDETAIVTTANTTKWCFNNCGGSSGDFLKESNSTTRQIASINYIAGYQGGTLPGGQTPGDPRYRGRLVSDRWNNDASRSDADSSDASNKLDALTDKADVNPRSFGFDWFDHAGDRPLAFIRNSSMLNIGELGNVATCEYPWRTIYLQYPERPANTTSAGTAAEIQQRRSKTMDSVLIDLLQTTSTTTRSGAININTQQRYGSTEQHALAPLFFGEAVATLPSLTQAMVNRLCTNTGAATGTTIFDHRIDPNTPVDNNPLRPFFQIGDLASVISRLVNSSPGGSGTTGSSNRSTVNYSMLRTNATTSNEAPTNGNIHQDMQVEQEFREITNSITTRGNSFRILYVGQAMKKGLVLAEYLGEAFVERRAAFAPEGSNPDAIKTSDSTYTIIANRVVTE
jgi:uncharacterized protein (UPF0333 family)